MKKVLAILVWMIVFFHVGGVVMIIVTGYFPLPSQGDFWLKLAIGSVIFLLIIGSPVLALILGIRGKLPGTRISKEGVNVPPLLPKIPPPLSKTPPPLPLATKASTGISAGKVHHAFTHENIPACFILGDNRAQYIAGLFRKELIEILRQSWRQVALEEGEDPSLADKLELTTFRNDPYIYGCWEFPPTKHEGEALCGLVVVGPLGEFASINWAAVPVRYFILERGVGPLTRLLEWSPNGYNLISSGPHANKPITVFTDMVINHVMGKKRPSAEQVAKRLLVLKHLGVYAQTVPLGQQLHAQPDLKPEAKADMHAIFGGMFSAKIRGDNLWEDVSPKEQQFLEQDVKDIPQQHVVDMLWRLEAIQVFMWALGFLPELPPFSTKATAEIFKQMPQGTTAELVASAKLRDEKEIDRARKIAELWHWRSRTRQMQVEGRPCPITDALKSAGLDSYEAVIRTTVQVAVKDGLLTNNTGDDFLVCGKAYRDMTADEWADVRSVTMERHYALNWLCGRAPSNNWDNTPTDT